MAWGRSSDCNGTDDAVEYVSETGQDCNSNGVLDECDAARNCSCAGWPCTSDQDCDSFPGSGDDIGSGLFGQAFKLVPSTAGADPQGIRGPLTHDEQPANPNATGEPGMEYWEFDAVLDVDPENDSNGVFFVIGDECANAFVNDDNGGAPPCWTTDPPTCLLIEQGANNMNTYARFNAGIWFHKRWTTYDNPQVYILSNGQWRNPYGGSAPDWYPGYAKHITIEINNELDQIGYYRDPCVPGERPMWVIHAGTQTPGGTGGRQVLMFTTSTAATGYFDNLKHSAASNCDHDGIPDANDIAAGTSWDCNANSRPDECEPNRDGDSIPEECDVHGWDAHFFANCMGEGVSPARIVGGSTIGVCPADCRVRDSR